VPSSKRDPDRKPSICAGSQVVQRRANSRIRFARPPRTNLPPTVRQDNCYRCARLSGTGRPLDGSLTRELLLTAQPSDVHGQLRPQPPAAAGPRLSSLRLACASALVPRVRLVVQCSFQRVLALTLGSKQIRGTLRSPRIFSYAKERRAVRGLSFDRYHKANPRSQSYKSLD
jgi:hypothetical protein